LTTILPGRLLAILALCTSYPAVAAIFCVDNAADLASALQAVDSNGEDNEVYLKVGTYIASIHDGFFAFPGAGHSLTVEGGYSAFGFTAGQCVAQTRGTRDPLRTIIDGAGTNVVVMFTPLSNGNGDISVRSLTLQNGVPLESYSPVFLGSSDNGWAGTLTVEDVIIRGNQNATYDVISMRSDLGKVVVRNVVVSDNSTDGPDVLFLKSNYTGSGAGIVFNNNTVVRNRASRTDVDGGAYIFGSADADIGNNIFWNNDRAGLILDGTGQYALTHNDIGTLIGTPASNTNPFDVAPGFVGTGDYRLDAQSPLINVGNNSVSGGHGSYDAQGLARVVGGTVDVGANEWRDVIFADGFD
jgi:hypothetical protein